MVAVALVGLNQGEGGVGDERVVAVHREQLALFAAVRCKGLES